MSNRTVHKAITRRDIAKLDEAHKINKDILIAVGVKPDTIFCTSYKSSHPACTATTSKIVDINQESQIKSLFISDASVFPTPLGMPPILTIVALLKFIVNSKILATRALTGIFSV
jgi:choline dehydrogenase-like flavoprotein